MNLRQPWPGNLYNLGKSVKFGTQIIFEMSNKTKVLIIDDDEKSVEKLSEVLSDYPDLEVTGSAGLCSKGRELVAELKPDLLFLDIELPDCNGLDFVKGFLSLGDDETFHVHCSITFFLSHSRPVTLLR